MPSLLGHQPHSGITTSSRRALHVCTVVLLALSVIVLPVGSRDAYAGAPSAVFVLGGAATVGEVVLQQARAVTGVEPVRLAGADRFETAAAISRQAFPSGAGTVYLASGLGFADALAASGAVAASGGTLLLVAPDGMSGATTSELARLRPSRVFVLGGAATVGEVVLQQARAVTGVEPVRLAGADRFETAAAISRQAFPSGAGTVYLASGLGFADALAASGAVAASGGTLLLVAPDDLRKAAALEMLRRSNSRSAHMMPATRRRRLW